MSKKFRPWQVADVLLLPPSVTDFVPAGHFSHFVRDMVREQLDLSAITGDYREDRGYPPYDPGMMTAFTGIQNDWFVLNTGGRDRGPRRKPSEWNQRPAIEGS